MSHPGDSTLAEFAQGMLDGAALFAVEAHLAGCSSCSAVAARLLSVIEPPRTEGPHRGLVVGRYTVLDAVGAGGLGEVFSAWDSGLERTVALKWLFPSVVEQDREALRARLLAEARALARIRHPNVVTVHDVISHGGSDVIVMELIERGRSVRGLPGAGWRSTVRDFVEAADGLVAAHDAGVIHRDFKSDNVLIDHRGRVVVVDFGLARPQGAVSVALTPGAKHSSVSGTPAYLAPERWRGAPADAASDQYSFCVSLFECLSERLPFQGVTVEARLEEMRAGPPTLPPSVGRRVSHAILRGLEFEPAQRWPSMRALRDELRDALEGPRRRRRALLLATAVVGLVGGVSLAAARATSRCRDVEAPVRATWTPTRQQRVSDAFLATKHPAAAGLASSVTAAVEALARDIATSRTRACVATAHEGESEALLASRQACLSGRLSDLDALLTRFEAADGRTVERAVDALEAIAPPSECLGPAQVPVSSVPLGAHQRLEPLQREVARVRATRLTGKAADSVELAQRLAPEVAALGWPPLESELSYEWSMGLKRQGKHEESRARLLDAFDRASAGRDDSRGFDVLLALAYLDGLERKLPESGTTWVRLARAHAGERTDRQRHRLALLEASMLGQQGRLPEAIAALSSLRDALDASVGDRRLTRARVRTNLAWALGNAGRHAEAAEASRESVELLEGVLAPLHPDIAIALNNRGTSLTWIRRFDEAETALRRSREIHQAVSGPDSLVLALPFVSLGDLELERGNGTAALEAYRRARGLIEENGGPEADLWQATLGEGLACGATQQHAEAVRLLDEALPQLERRQASSWDLARARLGLAISLRAMHRADGRVVELLTSVAALEGPLLEPFRTKAKGLLAQRE